MPALPSSATSEATTERARFVLVVSGRRLIAEALQDLLATQRGVEELREAEPTPGRSTLIVDLDEPGVERHQLAEMVTERRGVRRIGFYDAFTSPIAQLAFELGLTLVLPLSSPVEHLVDLVLAHRRDSHATTAVGLSPDELLRLNSLTPRELEVLNHVALGRPVRLVANLMGITVHTVETHKRRCFAKLGVQRQAHAVALAVSAGMISSA